MGECKVNDVHVLCCGKSFLLPINSFLCINRPCTLSGIFKFICTFCKCHSSVDRQESIDIPSTPVLENPEHQTLWYCKYFLGKYHYNFVGQEINDGEKSTYVLSCVEEISFGKTHCRCIMWAKDGPKRLVIAGAFKSKTVRHILAQFGYTGPKIDQSPKQVRQLNRKVEYRKRIKLFRKHYIKIH